MQQRVNSRAEAVADLISEQVSARQSLDVESNRRVVNQISTVSQSAHPLSVVALAIALVVLVIAIGTFVPMNPVLKLFWAALSAVLCRGPLRSAYSDHTGTKPNQVKVVSVLQTHHKRIEYRARLTRNQTLETLETQVTNVLHTSGKTRLD